MKIPGSTTKNQLSRPNVSNEISSGFSQSLPNHAYRKSYHPLQTGSQKILVKMNRHYDIGEALAICTKIKELSPSTIIVAHFIIGHPGETWRDYWRSLAASRFFDNPIPLAYSRNKNTVSATMADQISKPIRSLRLAIFVLFHNVVVLFRIVDTIKQKVAPS